MVERRTDFPALELRKADLERQYSIMQQQINDAIFAGKSETGLQMYTERISEELDELRYVLKTLSARDGRIEISGPVALTVAAVMLLILVAQIVILFWVGH